MSFCGLIFVFIFEQAVLWPVLFYVFLWCCSVFVSCLVCTIKFLKWNFSLCVQCMFFANIHIKWGGCLVV